MVDWCIVVVVVSFLPSVECCTLALFIPPLQWIVALPCFHHVQGSSLSSKRHQKRRLTGWLTYFLFFRCQQNHLRYVVFLCFHIGSNILRNRNSTVFCFICDFKRRILRRLLKEDFERKYPVLDSWWSLGWCSQGGGVAVLQVWPLFWPLHHVSKLAKFWAGPPTLTASDPHVRRTVILTRRKYPRWAMRRIPTF